ncbi:T9SS type A sorting domain-containing protein [Flexithrix dorotheae]|uniref:T9SS type A sorting domain-containing protein n=1 Tax=Flexithrix dorotheae TaxID=70993 RepID=UPI000373B729|nr:T9SS type A sorting domain-containing protein [Flexithrix dorotheae]
MKVKKLLFFKAKTVLVFTLFWVMGYQIYAQTPVFINEIHYDNASTDVGESIEIAGPADTDLTGWSIVLYNGSNGSVYNTSPLSGTINDLGNGYGVVTQTYPSNGIQNGAPDGIALVNAGGSVIQFLSYEGTFAAVEGPANGLTSTDIGVAETSSTPEGASLQLNGTGTNYEDFTWSIPATSTFNAFNIEQTFGTPVVKIVINEIDSDNPGTDALEFIELYDGGVGNSPLNGLIVVLYNGSNDESYNTIDLSGEVTDANGYFVIGSANVTNVDLVAFTTNGLQNGQDAVALYMTDPALFPNNTPVTTTDLIDAIVYGTGDPDDTELSILLNAGQAQLDENINGDKDNQSLQRIPNGEGGERNTSSFAATTPTPGASNALNVPVADFVVINEIDADQISTDAGEFIELYDGGIGNTALDGLSIVFYNGSDNASYAAYDLDGFTTSNDGYFVLGNAAVANVGLVFPDNSFQNGADAIALYKGDAANFPNDTPLSLTDLIDAVVYDTDDADNPTLLTLLNNLEPQLNENENGAKDTESLQRIPNGDGGQRNTSAFSAATPTPGEANDDYVNPPTGDPISIAEARSKAIGETVTIQGILTVADEFGGPAYIQDTTGGIPIFDNSIHGNGLFQIGQELKITAERTEFQQQIQLGNVSAVTLLGAASVPAPVDITLAELGIYEGQLVRIASATFPNPNNLFYGNSNYIISDASGSGELRIDGDASGLSGKTQPENCEVIGVVGSFAGTPQLLPRYGSDLPCAEAFTPPPGSGSSETALDIVTWNIEWFGNTGNGPSPESEQKDSVKSAILQMDADIYALQEIADENLLAQLVSELPAYDMVIQTDFVSYPPNVPGNSQKLAFVYKTAIIAPVSSKGLLASIHPYYNGGNTSLLPGYPDPDVSRFYASGRLPFLLEADVNINGTTERVHFVNLHARANSSSDAQLRYEMRKYDVEVLKDSLDVHFSDKNLVLLGDYNDDVDETVADISSTMVSSYEAFVNDPDNYAVKTISLSNAGFRSYAFRENMIDHITLSNELFDNFNEGSEIVHLEFFSGNYTNTTSDHFPVSLSLNFEEDIPESPVSGFTMVNPKTGKDIGSLNDGTIINIQDYSAEQRTSFIAIKAETAEKEVESIYFKLEGDYNWRWVDNKAPYSLFGDFWKFYFGRRLRAGKYTLSATPYSKNYAKGEAGIPLSISFEVIDGTASNSRIAAEINDLELPEITFDVYPNPSSGDVNFFVNLQEFPSAKLSVYNAMGQSVFQKQLSQTGVEIMDFSKLGKGIYFTKFILGDRIQTKRFVIE